MATREIGFVNARKYDLEVWAPGAERWLEVSSVSNFRDYQARRMAIRHRPEPGAQAGAGPHAQRLRAGAAAHRRGAPGDPPAAGRQRRDPRGAAPLLRRPRAHRSLTSTPRHDLGRRICDAIPWRPRGGVAEWTNAAVLKTAVGASPPWVRIPPPPPFLPLPLHLPTPSISRARAFIHSYFTNTLPPLPPPPPHLPHPGLKAADQPASLDPPRPRSLRAWPGAGLSEAVGRHAFVTSSMRCPPYAARPGA